MYQVNIMKHFITLADYCSKISLLNKIKIDRKKKKIEKTHETTQSVCSHVIDYTLKTNI